MIGAADLREIEPGAVLKPHDDKTPFDRRLHAEGPGAARAGAKHAIGFARQIIANSLWSSENDRFGGSPRLPTVIKVRPAPEGADCSRHRVVVAGNIHWKDTREAEAVVLENRADARGDIDRIAALHPTTISPGRRGRRGRVGETRAAARRGKINLSRFFVVAPGALRQYGDGASVGKSPTILPRAEPMPSAVPLEKP